MEARQVDEGVSGQKEIGCDDADSVEASNHGQPKRHNKHKDVAAIGIVVGVGALGKEEYAWVDFVDSYSLQYSWCANQ